MNTIADRYEIKDRLGSGASETSLGVDGETGEKCVVKELTLGRLTDWKQLDLFERESSALRQLDHPGVPRFVDSIQVEEPAGPRFYLIQQYVAGTPLARHLAGRGEGELQRVLESTLEILAYLQDFSPPVIHRDIQPDNVLIGSDGRVSLVDFGSVQVELQGTLGGSTVVGTSGYMAPEQLMGRALPASDVYALGASFVHVMTKTHPSDLPMSRMQLRWKHLASSYDERLVEVVDRMIAPNPRDRFANAREVSRALGTKSGSLSISRAGQTIRATKPADTKITLSRSARTLTIDTPKAAGSSLPFLALLVMLGGAVVAVILSKVGLSMVAAISIGVGSLMLLAAAIGQITHRMSHGGKLVLDIDRGYRIKPPAPMAKMKAGPFKSVIGPDKGYGGQARNFYLVTEEGTLEVARGCTPEEQDWLLDEIADFIRENRG